jgi:protein-tyrosine phosphatase
MSNPSVSTPRVVALEGGHNFREVGGYPTRSGATLRRAMLWRSAGLNRLSAIDCRTIRALGIRTIADLRTEHERIAMPTPTDVSEGLSLLSWPSNADDVSRRAGERPAWRDLEPAALRGEVARLYTFIAEAHARQFADVYRAIADGAAPILIHCTAGKDRTGLAVALLLELIGVTREWVVWDYEQTNIHLDKSKVDLESAIAVGGTADWLAHLGPEGRELLLMADAAYLMAAIDGIEARYGTVEGFARTGLGLSPEIIQELRRRLLEGPAGGDSSMPTTSSAPDCGWKGP